MKGNRVDPLPVPQLATPADDSTRPPSQLRRMRRPAWRNLGARRPAAHHGGSGGRPLAIIVLTTLLITVPVLGYLQYHWLGQVSDLEEQRLEESLRRASQRFLVELAEEFRVMAGVFAVSIDGETENPGAPAVAPGAPAVAAGVDPAVAPGVDPAVAPGVDPAVAPGVDPAVEIDLARRLNIADFTERLEFWRANSRFPGLVERVAIAAVCVLPGGVFDVCSLSWDTEAPVDQPNSARSAGSSAGNNTVDAVLAAFAAAVAVARDQSTVVAAETALLSAVAENPALMGSPVMIRNPAPADPRRGFGDADHRTGLAGVTVLVGINLDVLRDGVIPYYADRAFRYPDGTMAVTLEVVDRLPSNPGDPRSVREPVAIVPVPAPALTGFGAGGFARGEPLGASSRQMTIPQSLQTSVVRFWLESFNDQPVSGADAGREPPAGRSVAAPWELRVYHPTGSLQTVVARQRVRNTAVALGVLFAMAAAIVVLFVLYRQEERLRRQENEFVASVSHELRTPLAVMYSAGENLSEGLVRSPEQVGRYGRVLVTEARRLRSMVEKIFQYSGIETRNEPRVGEVDVAALMATLSPLFYAEAASTPGGFSRAVDTATVATGGKSAGGAEPAASARGAGTPGRRIAIDRSPVASFCGDGDAIRSIIENLVFNALKHTRADVRVKVAEEPVHGRRELVLRVEDDGPGIARSEQRRMFQPFQRGRNAVENQVPGSGLGLSLVTRLVAAMRGTIRLDSPYRDTAGKHAGCRFEVRIPMVGHRP